MPDDIDKFARKARWTHKGGKRLFLWETLDRSLLTDRVSKLARAKLDLILSGIDVILSR